VGKLICHNWRQRIDLLVDLRASRGRGRRHGQERMRTHRFLADRKFCEEFIVAWINKRESFVGPGIAEAQVLGCNCLGRT
jgi:hypothetical protein